MDYLKKENTNKQKCKSCMFNYNENSVELSVERMAEIVEYLITFKKSHICHTTNKTCYGGLELQASVMHVRGIIPEPTVESMLETAEKYING